MSNATDKLNTLESVILSAEDSAEDARWQQAQEVARLLDAGSTQRQIAADWINGRTGKSYAQTHVKDVAKVWRRFGEQFTVHDRPDWTTAYYTVQQGADDLVEPEQRRSEWTQAHEARAPKSQATAERLVENLRKSSPEVVETVARGILPALSSPQVERVIEDANDVAVERIRAKQTERDTTPKAPTAGDLMGGDRFDPSESWADTHIIRAREKAHALRRQVEKWGLVLGSMTDEQAYDYLQEAERNIAEVRVTLQERLRDRDRSEV